MITTVERDLAGRQLTIEAGKVAKQANGAVTVRYGDTMVLVAAVSAQPRPGIDFFPLTVEYREKMFAAGKIPGGRFYKREGRPSSKEVLTCRMIDRPIRPLFPEGFIDEVQITNIVLSADRQNDPDVLAMIGASAALAISDIPFNGVVGSVRIGRVNGELVVNPTRDQIDEGELDLVLSSTEDAICMVEAAARELPEQVILEALMLGHQQAQPVIEMVRELAERCGKPKFPFEPAAAPHELAERVRQIVGERLEQALRTPDKQPRHQAVRDLLDEALEQLCTDHDDAPEPGDVKEVFDDLRRRSVRSIIIGGQRVDGRSHEEIRPIRCEVGLLPRAHGSALFTRGETQALVTTTLGTQMDEEYVDGLDELYMRKFMLQYNFPAFSVGEAKPPRGPSRRDIGHGALAERAISPVLPEVEDFPYTIRVVSDVLESNGSSSMASVCGATLCMMDGGVPIADPVAGIAMGLVKDGDRVAILSDILGEEDRYGDMDFKVAGTQRGVTALQMDCKLAGLSEQILGQALEQAREGRMHILRAMLEALDRPRRDISIYAPRLIYIKVPVEKIGAVIGPGGRTIRTIEMETGAKVEIADDGTITISSVDMSSVEKAKVWIEGLTEEPVVGRAYDAKIVSVRDFGAFAEFLPGQEGMIHVSELDEGYVDRVEDVVSVGDEVRVKVVRIEDNGRVRLSRKAVLLDERGAKGDRDDSDRRPRRSHRRGRRR